MKNFKTEDNLYLPLVFYSLEFFYGLKYIEIFNKDIQGSLLRRYSHILIILSL